MVCTNTAPATVLLLAHTTHLLSLAASWLSSVAASACCTAAMLRAAPRPTAPARPRFFWVRLGGGEEVCSTHTSTAKLMGMTPMQLCAEHVMIKRSSRHLHQHMLNPECVCPEHVAVLQWFCSCMQSWQQVCAACVCCRPAKAHGAAAWLTVSMSVSALQVCSACEASCASSAEAAQVCCWHPCRFEAFLVCSAGSLHSAGWVPARS
jgi:hypothetical protein